MATYSTYSDEQLIILLKKSDQNAYTTLYNRYWKPLFTLIYKHLGSKPAAEDLVQELFISIWSKRQSLQIDSFKAWIGAAAKYMIIAETNRQLRKELFPKKLSQPDHDSLQPVIDFRFLEQQLQKEISLLPAQCRLIFTYSRNSEMSNAEIAEKLGISEKAVEKQITIARKRLNIALRNFLFSAL